ncbi:hypothetical protein BZA70DRAFT_281980 [Myxozyma melibiosi]|uniref:ATPase expression protein 1 n=1 Tax=Myxozyma melibiosi TaxID=54550 RepID=A0ABR1F3V0_9ASCO
MRRASFRPVWSRTRLPLLMTMYTAAPAAAARRPGAGVPIPSAVSAVAAVRRRGVHTDAVNGEEAAEEFEREREQLLEEKMQSKGDQAHAKKTRHFHSHYGRTSYITKILYQKYFPIEKEEFVAHVPAHHVLLDEYIIAMTSLQETPEIFFKPHAFYTPDDIGTLVGLIAPTEDEWEKTHRTRHPHNLQGNVVLPVMETGKNLEDKIWTEKLSLLQSWSPLIREYVGTPLGEKDFQARKVKVEGLMYDMRMAESPKAALKLLPKDFGLCDVRAALLILITSESTEQQLNLAQEIIRHSWQGDCTNGEVVKNAQATLELLIERIGQVAVSSEPLAPVLDQVLCDLVTEFTKKLGLNGFAETAVEPLILAFSRVGNYVMALTLLMSARVHSLSPHPDIVYILLYTLRRERMRYFLKKITTTYAQQFAFSFLGTAKRGFFRPYFLSRAASTYDGFSYLTRSSTNTTEEAFSLIRSMKGLEGKSKLVAVIPGLIKAIRKACLKGGANLVSRGKDRREVALAMMMAAVDRIDDEQAKEQGRAEIERFVRPPPNYKGRFQEERKKPSQERRNEHSQKGRKERLQDG